MNTRLTALTLFTITAAAVGLYPATQGAITSPPDKPPGQVTHLTRPPIAEQTPKIDVVFVLDTTGSMGGLIEGAKEKIWSIASSMAQAKPAPLIRMGLVAYRDRGDDYVTKVVDLSDDLDSVYATLMDFQADGGGDGPESVNQALHDAVNHMSWNSDQQTYKVMFLVGDAPPHMDYQDDVKYPQTLAKAVQQGITVNAIQCGNDSSTLPIWQQIAKLGSGQSFQVDQSGGAIAIATPYDEHIASLSSSLDETRIYFGTEQQRAAKQSKVAATDKLHAEASVAVRARRAVFNASASGERNLLGEQELVEAVTEGKLDLKDIDSDMLPAPLQAMAPEEQLALVKEKADRRDQLQRQIAELAEERDAFLKKKREELGTSYDAFDDKVYQAVKMQAEEKGLVYSEDESKD